MTATEKQAFTQLFRAVCAKCFGRVLEQPLPEPEWRHLSNEIEEKTGLVIGWKSLKNYAVFVLNPEAAKPENPSTATLDTLARYLAAAPFTTEAQRKREGAHFNYWFRYLAQNTDAEKVQGLSEERLLTKRARFVPLILIVSGLAALAIFVVSPSRQQTVFFDDFKQLEAESLTKNGWVLLSKDPAYWNQSNETPGYLTLFTLWGDNWRSREQTPRIRNFLARKIEDDCFDAEVHFSGFIPQENWQQAGLLLLEDTAYLGKSLRLSLAFNNFFGGFDRPDEILVQGVADFGKNSPNVEEVLHYPLFSLQDVDPGIVRNNLQYSALRIEKRENRFRFLYAASPFEHFSYKEIGVYDFDFQPNYVGIFALKGFVDSTAVMPVRVRFFRVEGWDCD